MPSHCHDIRTFAPLGLSNGPPFFALTKVPSRLGSSLTLFLSAILGSADGKPLGTAIGLADLARQPRYEAPTESYSLHLDCNSRSPLLSSRGFFTGISRSKIAHYSSVSSIGHAHLLSLTFSTHF
jgi:hypothetical protein